MVSFVQMPLWSLLTLKQIDNSIQLGAVYKHTKDELYALIQIIDKDVNQDTNKDIK